MHLSVAPRQCSVPFFYLRPITLWAQTTEILHHLACSRGGRELWSLCTCSKCVLSFCSGLFCYCKYSMIMFANYWWKLTFDFFLAITYLYILYTFLVVVTTEYISFHPVWTSGRAAGQPLVIQGTIFYPEETIMYPKSRYNFYWLIVIWAKSLRWL